MVKQHNYGSIKYSDWQQNWEIHISPLRKGKYTLSDTDFLSIAGDAPKSFVRIKEYIPGRHGVHPRRWIAYIAKIGSKCYPVESITEHLVTRIGQIYGVKIADSQLRIVGGQVRFLSKYFLLPTERLVHGIDIFKKYLDDEQMVKDISDKRAEKEFYTFQTICAAMKDVFPKHHQKIVGCLAEMLAFDSLVGNNDRHPANWGVIVSLRGQKPPCFAPVYDTARALFWNHEEARIKKMLTSKEMLNAYVEGSEPLIGWDGEEKIKHFAIISAIKKDYPHYRGHLEKFASPQFLGKCGQMIDEEFVDLLSQERRMVIKACLQLRHQRFCHSIQ